MLAAELDLLVISAQEGNEEAFKVLVIHYHKGLLRYALSFCNDPELAKDAVQDSWLKMTDTLRRLEDPRKFRGYMYQLVHWRCLDLGRKKKKRTEIEEPMVGDIATEITVSTAEVSETVAVLMKRLPALERQMLHLYYLEDFQVREIASILEIPQGTVKSRLSRARKLLKARYHEEN